MDEINLFLLHGIWGRDRHACASTSSHSLYLSRCDPTCNWRTRIHNTFWKSMLYTVLLTFTNWDPQRKSSLSNVSWLVAEPDLGLALHLTPFLVPWSLIRGRKKEKILIRLWTEDLLYVSCFFYSILPDPHPVVTPKWQCLCSLLSNPLA